MKKRNWNRQRVIWTLLSGALALGVVSAVGATETVRPGWSLMSPEEFAQHREVMGTLEGDELRQYYEAHRESIGARAAEQGFALPEGRGPDRAGMGRYAGSRMGRGMGPKVGQFMAPGAGRDQRPYMDPGMQPRIGRGMGPCAQPGAGPRRGYDSAWGPGAGPRMGPYWSR